MACILHAPPRTSLVVNCFGVVRGLDPTFYGLILWNLVSSPVLLHMCVFAFYYPMVVLFTGLTGVQFDSLIAHCYSFLAR